MLPNQVAPGIYYGWLIHFTQTSITQAVGDDLAKELLKKGSPEHYPLDPFLETALELGMNWLESGSPEWVGDVKKNLIPASGGNTKAAAGAIMNAPAEGETNIHGALKAALGLHEKPTLSAKLMNIPDTVYFLTDGSPTRGEITATPELLGWFSNLNRFAKVKLHVVAFGNLGVDLEFLRRLAEAGDGDFIHVPEK